MGKYCLLCGKELAPHNKSSYCTSCYTKSPAYKKYQRDFQRKAYYERGYAEKKKVYCNKPAVRKRRKAYMKFYSKMYNSLADVKKKKHQWEVEHQSKYAKCNTTETFIYYMLYILCVCVIT
jgi:hypothetical protein